MTSFNELVIGSSQGFAFLLKIITEVFQDYVHLQGHGLAMISHKCEPSVSKEFNLFSVVDFYCLCVCHSNSPTVCSALKNGHLLCRIEHFHFLDGMLTLHAFFTQYFIPFYHFLGQCVGRCSTWAPLCEGVGGGGKHHVVRAAEVVRWSCLRWSSLRWSCLRWSCVRWSCLRWSCLRWSCPLK